MGARIFGHNWGGYHYPRHLQIPSRRGLSGLFKEVGFAKREDPGRAAHPDDDLASELARPTGVAAAHEIRQDAHLHRAPRRRPCRSRSIAWVFNSGGIIDFRAQKPRC